MRPADRFPLVQCGISYPIQQIEGVSMAEFNFAVPILPGKTEAWRKAIEEMKGPRREDYKRSRKNLGIKREQVCLQMTPHGDMVVVHIEAKDPANVMPGMFAAATPFDVWFLETVLRGVHGIDPKGPPPPAPEVVLDFKG